MAKVIIEKAKEKDKPRVFQLLKQANMHYIPSKEMPALTYDNYFVAKKDDRIIGLCGYKILSSTKAKTELMVVDVNCRGYGAGYKLQKKRMEDMLKKGIKTLITNADLPQTIKWYKKYFGYRQIGTLKKIHEFGDPSINNWTTLQVDLCEWDAKRKKEGCF